MIVKKQNLITSYFFRYKPKEEILENEFIKINIEKNDISISIDNIYGYNDKTGNWHCLECGDNMGDNPRQLCGKGYCYNNI